jgi:hypothetical protein
MNVREHVAEIVVGVISVAFVLDVLANIVAQMLMDGWQRGRGR